MDGWVSISLSWGLTFLTQTGAGILANCSLLCLYNVTLLNAHVLRPTELILNQLILANNLVLFSKGIPQTAVAFGLKSFLSDAGCKFVFYLHRVARGVSLSTTCLLSGFQAIKLCPSFSGWLEHRVRSTVFIGFCCSICWILHLLLNMVVTMNVTGPKNSKNTSVENIYRYCSSRIPERLVFCVSAVIYASTDGVCLGLMVWTSGSMDLVLPRHKQRVQHIHRNRLSPRPAHEARATRTILTLVSMFVSLHSLAGILSFWMTQLENPHPWLMNTSVLVSFGFPTFSPFVFLFSDTSISEFCFVCWTKNTNAPSMVSGP
ncbi:vomeronasal type-1 receptor 1-like [Equus quagga]|uniref:vomeronasal type-1 receptor 1-like n=1 Tax=Equus quagga TaxID=89248 RepID=UPI001EE1F536|nr:vomeronasal type-1 receptor 1-like [Equus quagga]